MGKMRNSCTGSNLEARVRSVSFFRAASTWTAVLLPPSTHFQAYPILTPASASPITSTVAASISPAPPKNLVIRTRRQHDAIRPELPELLLLLRSHGQGLGTLESIDKFS